MTTTETGPWHGGWLTGVRHAPSPNFGPRPTQTSIDLIVIHSISLPPGQYGGPEVEQFFCNHLNWDAHPYFESIRGLQVSAHFFVRRSAEVVQFVSCDDRAWHAGASSFAGRANCNDFAIGIELEGLEGHGFEKAQYEALADLIESITSAYPVCFVTGHEHIAPGRKADPGPGFDWLRLQQGLGHLALRFPITSAEANSETS